MQRRRSRCASTEARLCAARCSAPGCFLLSAPPPEPGARRPRQVAVHGSALVCPLCLFPRPSPARRGRARWPRCCTARTTTCCGCSATSASSSPTCSTPARPRACCACRPSASRTCSTASATSRRARGLDGRKSGWCLQRCQQVLSSVCRSCVLGLQLCVQSHQRIRQECAGCPPHMCAVSSV